jgi:hypothetical protein
MFACFIRLEVRFVFAVGQVLEDLNRLLQYHHAGSILVPIALVMIQYHNTNRNSFFLPIHLHFQISFLRYFAHRCIIYYFETVT